MNENQENPQPPVTAVAVGAVLRQTREEQGLSVLEAAQALKLAPRQVEAIEEERFELLPGPAFVRGFVRNYARLLQLDPVPLLGALSGLASQGRVSLSPVRNAEGEMPTRFSVAWRSSWRWFLMLILVLGVAVAGGYWGWFAQEPTSTVSDPVSAPSLPTPPANTLPAGFMGPPHPEILDDGEDPPPSTAAQTPALAPTAGADPAHATPTESTPPAAEAGESTAEAAASPAPGEAVLELRFSGESWVEVRQGTQTGRLLFSQMFSAGQTHRFTGTLPLAFVVGNAREVKLTRNGNAVDLTPHTRVSVARFVLSNTGAR